MPHLISSVHVLKNAFNVCTAAQTLPSPEQLRTILAESISTVMEHHQNYHSSNSSVHVLKNAFNVCTAAQTLPSPEQLRTILAESISTVMEHHQNYHSSNAFCRNTQKLPLDKLTDYIFSMQSSNLPVQIASYSGYCEEHQLANSTLSEARSKLNSQFFKDIFDQVMERLQFTGAFFVLWLL